MRIDGIGEAVKKLEKLAAGTQWRALSQSTAAAARVVARKAKSNAPVGSVAHRGYTGALIAPGYSKSTVKAVRFRRKYNSVALVGVGPNKLGYYTAQFVEGGHKDRAGGSVPAKPWLKPALDSTESQLLSAFESKMKTFVNKAIR